MLYTGIISYTGVIFISLGISFLIPVIDATVLKRQISLQIHALGGTPKEILQKYGGDHYNDLTGYTI